MATKDSAKTPAAPKARKPAAPKTVVKAAAAPTPMALMPPTREQIARLAEKYWIERGRPDGTPEHDWLRAEQELRGKAS